MPSDKELGELFGNRGDTFLKEAPARIMSQRGYGNIRSKYPIDPSKDINTTYPEYKLHTGIFNCVKSDFPKGAGGASENPMWVDGTYEDMKRNFNRQADEQNDVRHLIPDLEDQRLKQYDLANFTGGTAQQNKLDFMLKEAMTETERIKNQQKIETILKEFPMLSREDASKIVADEAVRERIRLMEKRGITMSDLMANDVAVNVVRLGHPDQAQDEARGGVRTTRDASTQTEPNGMAGYRYSADIASSYPYFKDTSRSVASPPSTAPSSRPGTMEGRSSDRFTPRPVRNVIQGIVGAKALARYSREIAGSAQGVGMSPAPLPNIGSGGGGGSQRSRRESIPARNRSPARR